MIGFNHAAVGGLIALALPLPLAVPLAFASHFVLDALPHYGIEHDWRDSSKLWKWFGIVDFLAGWIVIGGLSLLLRRYDVFLCGLVAASPDFVWVWRIMRHRSFNLSDNKSRFSRWHKNIQQFERPWGIYIEIPLAVVLFILLFHVAVPNVTPVV
jgi:hypothetical protein